MPIQVTGRKSWERAYRAGRHFVKMHGLQNHFVIVDGRSDPYKPGKDEIARICNPRLGVGADQFVIVEMASRDRTATASVRFWNADGGEAEACGNATRCVAWLLLEETGADEVLLEAAAGLLKCRRAGPHTVSAGMGAINAGWRDIPLAGEHDTRHLDVGNGPLKDGVALNIGNPHVVYFVEDLDAIDLAKLAPPIQENPLFPEGVNVGAAEMRSDDSMRLQVFERGAGLTMACGSGACVAVFAAQSRGLTDSRKMSVELPGGALEVEILPDGSAVMTGPVEFSFSGHLPRY